MVVEVDPTRQSLDVVVVDEVVEVDSCGELLRRDVFRQHLQIGRQTVVVDAAIEGVVTGVTKVEAGGVCATEDVAAGASAATIESTTDGVAVSSSTEVLLSTPRAAGVGNPHLMCIWQQSS
jgi:hypothetical protein